MLQIIQIQQTTSDDKKVYFIIISALTKEAIHEESCDKPEQTTCIKEEYLF